MARVRTARESITQALARIDQDDRVLDGQAADLILRYLGIDGFRVVQVDELKPPLGNPTSKAGYPQNEAV